VLQEPLELPIVPIWTLIIAGVLAAIGLSILLPKRYNKANNWINVGVFHGGDDEPRSQTAAGNGSADNNPVVNVSFGGASRYLHSDCLETATLNCSFGGLDIYFDQAQISPNGAEVNIQCSFGGIDLYVPRHWQVINNVSCSLGAVDINNRRAVQTENAPTLTLNGSVSFGGVDVKLV